MEILKMVNINFKNPKVIIPVVVSIVGGWLIASSGTNLLDYYFALSDWAKFISGLGLLWLGVIKFRGK